MPISTHSLENEESKPQKHSKKRSKKNGKHTSHLLSHDIQLLEAVPQGKLRVIKRLLDSRANPNHVNEHGQTALMLACTIPDFETRIIVLETLLKRGADVNMQDLKGKTVLISAVQLEDFEVASYLLDYKANVKLADSEGNNALFYAAVRGNEDLVHKLVEVTKQQGADVDQQNIQGLTPLLAACQEGHLEVARILVQVGGASPSIRDLDQFMNAEEWIQSSGFFTHEQLSFLSPSQQKKNYYKKKRQVKGIRTLADYISSQDECEGSDSPNVFSLRKKSLEEERLPDITQPLSMFGSFSGSAGASVFGALKRKQPIAKMPGYALGKPVPPKPSNQKTAFLTTKGDLYSSSYLSKRKSFLSKNPRSGFYHSGALEPLEDLCELREQSHDISRQSHEQDVSKSVGKKKHDLLPPIKR